MPREETNKLQYTIALIAFISDSVIEYEAGAGMAGIAGTVVNDFSQVEKALNENLQA